LKYSRQYFIYCENIEESERRSSLDEAAKLSRI